MNEETTYNQSLIQAGLSPEQAVIYEILIKQGTLPAGSINKKTSIKRGLVYKVLEQLEEQGLVIKHDKPGKPAQFEPAHPLKLKELAEKKEEQAKNAQHALAGIMNSMTSEFNLAIGKPGVQFYEGLEGVRKVAFDNLTSKTEILAYLDMSMITDTLKDMNEEYIKVRKRLKIKKRNLVNNTEENKTLLTSYNRDITDIKLLDTINQRTHFASMMQIYDNKVSYITLNPEKWIGVIIEDPSIADMHRQLYEYTWQKAIPLSELN